AVVAAWLRRILARTMADAVRDARRARRDPALERSLEAAVDGSASGLAALQADDPSPSAVAAAAEQQLRLADALVALPEPRRHASALNPGQAWPLAHIAVPPGPPPAAGASLLRRGLQQLRGLLRQEV